MITFAAFSRVVSGADIANSVTINTACSSLLYALDIACKALLFGECGSAIVGGSNLIFTVD